MVHPSTLSTDVCFTRPMGEAVAWCLRRSNLVFFFSLSMGLGATREINRNGRGAGSC